MILPVLSAPLIAALGPPGALVFNLIQCAVLLWLMYELASAATSSQVSFFWAGALFGLSVAAKCCR